MKKNVSFLEFIPAIISMLCAVGVMTFARACGLKPDGTWMRCHAAQVMVFIISVCLTLLMIFPVFINKKIIKSIFYIIGGIGGVLIFLIPGIIKPLCMMQTMRCYTVMQPYVRILSVVEILFCLILLVRINIKNRSND